MIEISFKYKDKTLKKKLMNTMQLRMVRTMMVKLFRIPSSMVSTVQFIWRERPDFVLEDEWKDLNFYSIESGHELELKAV
jgi:hypothetical protein